MTTKANPTNIRHVAIIMDGNGRWAKERAHPRVWGHVRGSQVVSQIVEKADELGVKALTLYAFSTENWSRPMTEVNVLFKLLKKYLVKEEQRIIRNNIKFQIIGDTSHLSADTRKIIDSLQDRTKDFDGLKLTFAFGYGGRKEIVDAFNRFASENPGKTIGEDDLNEYLYRPEIGDVDLLIRTGGDQRVSNYLLWQIAYAELFFTKTKWPDFTTDEFSKIIELVSTRERRFGFVQGQDSLEESLQKASGNKAGISMRTI